MARPLIAIVGRPNVGKSLLFNRLAGQRLSIVEDTPGVTRDRLYATAEWSGRKFDIVDTGGIEPRADSEILLFMREQANIAINAADVIVLVTEIGTGVTAADKDVANLLLRSHKPVVLVVNKMDNPSKIDPLFYEFYSLGLGDPIPVSAVHGHGTGDMLDECLKYFPPEQDEEQDDDRIHVAIIGKPNVGKSSLTNLIAGEQRVIVSDVAGTTRDAVDSNIDNEFGKYTFIDTAGIRESSDTIEKAGIERSFRKVREADIVRAIADICKGPLADLSMIIPHVDPSHQKLFILLNKSDILSAGSPAPVSDVLSAGSPAALAKDIEAKTGFKTLAISALNPADIKAVKALLSSEMKDRIGEGGQTLVTNLRHYTALKDAQEALGRVREGLDAGRTTDLVAQDLRDAISALGEITGMDISEDEILGNIFSHFCIGK